MKTFNLFLLLLFVNNFTNAQTPFFQWAVSMSNSGNNTNIGYCLATDNQGNVYTSGNFRGIIDFDPGPLNVTLNATASDIFITKSDKNGNLIWAKQMSGNAYASGLSMTLDQSNHIYLTGQFQGLVDFDPGIGNQSIHSVDSGDVFIVKLDAQGNLIWVKTFGSTSSDCGRSITKDSSNNLYVTGNFGGSVDFNPGTGINLLNSSGANDIFVSKFDQNGNFLWARNIGGSMDDLGLSVKTDPVQHVYIGGSFSGTVDFDPGASNYNLTSNGGTDIFMLKLDSAGQFKKAIQTGGMLDDYLQALSIDPNGTIFSTGTFQDSVDFDSGPGQTKLNSNGLYDIFISSYDTSLKLNWAKQIGGTDYDYGWDIQTDSQGHLFITGDFSGSVDFDPGSGTNLATTTALSELYIVALDSSGNFIWEKNTQGDFNCSGLSLSANSAGDFYVTGTFRGTVDFDPDAGVFNQNGSLLTQIFIFKLGLTPNGIEESLENKNSKIYPNPSHGIFSFELSSKIEHAAVEILDGKGCLLYRTDVQQGLNQIDLSNQPNGVYFIKLFENNFLLQTSKVIKN